MDKVDTIEKWVVGPGGVVLSECENKTHAKEVAGIINSMIQAAYDKGYARGYAAAIMTQEKPCSRASFERR